MKSLIFFLALLLLSCEQSALIDHEHEHTHEHTHDNLHFIGNALRYHWHDEQGGIHFQDTNMDLTEEEIKEQLDTLFEDYWEDRIEAANKYEGKELIFRAKAGQIGFEYYYNKKDYIRFDLITADLKTLDRDTLKTFQRDKWYTLKIKVEWIDGIEIGPLHHVPPARQHRYVVVQGVLI